MDRQYDEAMRAVVEEAFDRYGDLAGREQTLTESISWREWRKAGEQESAEPIEYLCRTFALDDFERFVLLLLLEMELDRPVMAQRLEKCGFGCLSPAAVISLFQGERCFAREWYGSFLEGRALNGWIMEPGGNGGPGLWDPVRLDGRIRGLLLGNEWEDSSLDEYGFWIYPEEYDVSEMKGGFGEEVYKQWSGLFTSLEGRRVCLIRGKEGSGRKTQMRRFAREYGIPVFCADAVRMAELPCEGRSRLLRKIIRECMLWRAVLCLEWRDGAGEGADMDSLIAQVLRKAGDYLYGVVILLALEQEVNGLPGGTLQESVPMPDLREAAGLWREIGRDYSCAADVSAEEFAGMLVMTPGQIGQVFVRAEGLAKRDGGPRIERRHLKEACMRLTQGRMAGKASRVTVRYSLSDLILPKERMRQIEEACGRVKNRYSVYETWGFSQKNAYGTGVSLVFTGPPGTGKTMAAQAIAGELGLELYKIDLSAVVSKYIGETEKNLNLIFEEGRRLQAVLLFDEADVLFSKRTEIRDSHDKYSNMEAAFLLQKMEEYTGVAILATNYIQNMDEAFKRRVTYRIEFPFPGRELRKKLWLSMVPEKLPLNQDVNFDFLAEQFELSGSQIKNSLLNAAFLAAGRGDSSIGMWHIVQSVRKELLKSGKKLTGRELGEYEFLLAEEGESWL